MNGYVTGEIIQKLREKNGLTQKQLAQKIDVSDKTISKWETGRGLPDISLLESIATALKISAAELLAGEYAQNENKCANIKKSNFYVCPICGNIIFSMGKGAFYCCGIKLPPLESEKCDTEHQICVETVENEYYVATNHRMDKKHYISFFAYVTADKCEILKLYPQQNCEGRFFKKGRGKIYAFCNKDGLFRIDV